MIAQLKQLIYLIFKKSRRYKSKREVILDHFSLQKNQAWLDYFFFFAAFFAFLATFFLATFFLAGFFAITF
jgi:hypothetical protein